MAFKVNGKYQDLFGNEYDNGCYVVVTGFSVHKAWDEVENVGGVIDYAIYKDATAFHNNKQAFENKQLLLSPQEIGLYFSDKDVKKFGMWGLCYKVLTEKIAETRGDITFNIEEI